jgi:pantoate--beta-alanine ligase
MPVIIPNPREMIKARNLWLEKGLSIGFVPTMGALHEGHEELIKNARREHQIVVLSIFVNPTQFNNKNDLEKYPNTLDADIKTAQRLGVDAIFTPKYDDIYPDNYRYVLAENEFSKQLCGKDRPGHFDGVLTIVMKLFNIVKPAKAYFGEKDFQQLELIKCMVSAFFMDLEIVPVAIVRENDGLAKSSRNMRLNIAGRAIAPKIHEIITNSQSAESASHKLTATGFLVDYVTDIGNRRFVAVKTSLTHDGGEVRLIDNVKI